MQLSPKNQHWEELEGQNYVLLYVECLLENLLLVTLILISVK